MNAKDKKKENSGKIFLITRSEVGLYFSDRSLPNLKSIYGSIYTDSEATRSDVYLRSKELFNEKYKKKFHYLVLVGHLF